MYHHMNLPKYIWDHQTQSTQVAFGLFGLESFLPAQWLTQGWAADLWWPGPENPHTVTEWHTWNPLDFLPPESSLTYFPSPCGESVDRILPWGPKLFLSPELCATAIWWLDLFSYPVSNSLSPHPLSNTSSQKRNVPRTSAWVGTRIKLNPTKGWSSKCLQAWTTCFSFPWDAPPGCGCLDVDCKVPQIMNPPRYLLRKSYWDFRSVCWWWQNKTILIGHPGRLYLKCR